MNPNDGINNLPPNRAALITTGGNLLGGIFNTGSQLLTNHWNNQQQWEMWHANNSYNHPAAQMQRYMEAGLNPHLIYGQSNTAQPVNVGVAQPPNFDFLAQAANDSLSSYYTREHSMFDKLIKSADYIIKTWDGYVKQYNAENEIELTEQQIAKVKADVQNALKLATNLDLDNAIKELEKTAQENNLKFDVNSNLMELFPDMGPGMRLFISGLFTILEFLGAPVQNIISSLVKKK